MKHTKKEAGPNVLPLADGCLTALIFISRIELPEEKSSPERGTSHKEHVNVVPATLKLCIHFTNELHS